MESVSQCVARGAALMDDVMPGWEAKINLDRLRISSAMDCILGQCFDGYENGLRRVGLHPDGGAAHGFTHRGYVVVASGRGGLVIQGACTCNECLPPPWDEHSPWRELDREWTAFLQERSLVGLA